MANLSRSRWPSSLFSTIFTYLVLITFLIQTCSAAAIKRMIVGDSITHGFEGNSGNPNHIFNRDSTLNTDSTCVELSSAQAADGGSYSSKYYDMTESQRVLEEYHAAFGTLDQAITTKVYVPNFGTKWGAETNMLCSIDDDCNDHSCETLQKTDVGSAAALQIMSSMGNLLTLFHKLKEGVDYSIQYWTTHSIELTELFNPNKIEDNMPNTLILQEFLYALGNVIALASVFLIPATAAITAGTLGILAPGLATGVNTGLDDPSEGVETDLMRMEEVQKAVGTWFDSANTVLLTGWDSFYRHGAWSAISMPDLFDHGVYADWKAIPGVNPSLGVTDLDRNEMFRKLMVASIVNASWKIQRVWIMAFPMTEADFNSHESPAGSNDLRLKYWDPETNAGYFFQSLYKDNEGGISIPRFDDPPGWGPLEDVYGVPTSDVFRSSIKSSQMGGYNGRIPTDWINNLEDPKSFFDSAPTGQPGVFRIPVCNVTPDDGRIWGNQANYDLALQDFFDALVSPREKTSSGAYQTGKINSACYCVNQGKTDQNGVNFEDVIDVKGWADSSHCDFDYGDRVYPYTG